MTAEATDVSSERFGSIDYINGELLANRLNASNSSVRVGRYNLSDLSRIDYFGDFINTGNRPVAHSRAGINQTWDFYSYGRTTESQKTNQF